MPNEATMPASVNIELAVRRLIGDEPIAHLSLHSMDALIGGVKCGRIYVIPGEPGAGKSTLLVQLADDLASQGITVLFFSYEMDASQLIAKSFARLSGGAFGVGDIAGCASNPAMKAALDVAIERYKAFAHNIYYCCNATLDATRISGEIAKIERERGCKPVVFLDYIQAVPPPKGTNISDERLQIKATMAGLRSCANDHDVAIIAASSVGREHYEKQTTGLKCLGGSSSVEYTSDGIMYLAIEGKGADRASNYAREKRPVVVSAIKHRYGALGTIKLTFDPAHALFTER